MKKMLQYLTSRSRQPIYALIALFICYFIWVQLNDLSAVNPNFIDLTCKYKSCSPDKNDCQNRETQFSIDLLKKRVTGGDYNSYGLFLPEDTIADITPDQITIEQYWQVAEAPNRQFLINQFFINRFTGTVYADHYEFDQKSSDKNIKTIITKNSNGICNRIKNRLF